MPEDVRSMDGLGACPCIAPPSSGEAKGGANEDDARPEPRDEDICGSALCGQRRTDERVCKFCEVESKEAANCCEDDEKQPRTMFSRQICGDGADERPSCDSWERELLV